MSESLTPSTRAAPPACATRPPMPFPPAAAAELRPERGTSPIELLWDLVFVFAVTQVTTLLAHRLTWGRFGEAMLALSLVWWAWSAFVWAADAHETESRTLRAYLLSATVLIFIVGLALPHAFGSEALLFACAYALVRFLHLALYVDASRQGSAAWAAIAGIAVTVTIGMALLVAGAIWHGWQRVLLWTIAVAIDYAGPAWLTRERLRGLQQVAVAHFAERYGAFVIICLGESVVAIGVGVGTAERHLTVGLVLTAGLALSIALGMWWTYFDRIADNAQARLRAHADPVVTAADAYSYLHVLIIAGIIIFAGGVKLTGHSPPGEPMAGPGRLALCGGVALYLVGVTGFRLRILGERSYGRVVVAVALLALYAIGGAIAAWAIESTIAVLIGALCALESAFGRTPARETHTDAADVEPGPGPATRALPARAPDPGEY